MTSEISAGTLLVKEGTPTPLPLQFNTSACSPGWLAISHESRSQLGKDMAGAGWTFFFMAGEIQANGLGLSTGARMSRALAQIIDSPKNLDCNCLEILEVKQRSFLGLPYLSLSARSRHIQKSCSFQELSPRKQ
jgi:hypothetical protein